MNPEFQGLAALMTQAFRGVDLTPLGNQLIARVGQHPTVDSAEALLDLSVILHLKGNHDIALDVQQQALQLRQIYTLPARKAPAIRLLALMTPGPLNANTPLEFLVQDSDIELTLLFLAPNLPFPPTLPDHDVAFVAVGEADHSQALLRALIDLARVWPRPLLNAPECILRLSRNESSALLADAPGVAMPMARRVKREDLAQAELPVIVRPIDSHAGKGLVKAETSHDLEQYLATQPEPEFYVTPFVDYRSADGQFRKYRVVLIDGQPYASHMALSDHWMVHYLNGGMTESLAKREEEARFMARFDQDFAQRHRVALQSIHERLGLEYLVMDCAETREGQLLIFEVDSSAVVHAMDPVDLFPYKQPQMHKVFTAFRAMLERARQ